MNVFREHATNIKDLLRAHIGRHGMSVEECSLKTGITERRIKSHMDLTGSKPNADDMTAYLRALPDSFAAAYLSKSGIGHYRVAPEWVCPTHLLPVTGRLVTAIGETFDDGVMDHQERAILHRLFQEAGPRITAVGMALQ